MIRLLILISLVFTYFINTVDAAQKYHYVCSDISCYSTHSGSVNNNYYMYPVSTGSINDFSKTIDNKLLNNYINYYTTDTFVITGLCSKKKKKCEKKNSNISDTTFTLQQLINYNKPFGLYTINWFSKNTLNESFKDGYDYLFTKFPSIIDELHLNGLYPISDKKNKLSDLIPNILSYSGVTDKFSLRNICDNSKMCDLSTIKQLKYGTGLVYDYLSGSVMSGSVFNTTGFKIHNSTLSSNLIKAGSGVTFNVTFDDYLDFAKQNTNYNYKIYYNNVGDSVPDSTIIPNFDETFTIDNSTLSGTSIGLGDQIGLVINITSLDNLTNRIKVGITEQIGFTKAGSKNFYLQVTNNTSGYQFPIMKVNNIPLEILPSDNVVSGIGIIPIFNTTANLSGYGELIPFKVNFTLKDSFGNNISDQIDGYDISLSQGSSNSVEISALGKTTSVWGNTLTGITTDINGNGSFYFRINTPGYFKIKGFDFKVRNKLDKGNYSTPAVYFILKSFIPNSLLDINGLQRKIYIKQPVVSSLPLTCGKTVTVSYTCISDNLSGCYPLANTTITYDNENQNGTQISLKIRDYAYNWVNYNGTLNHVDTTAPTITINKVGGGSSNILQDNSDFFANSDSLVLDFYESTTNSCIAQVNYDVQLDGVTKKTGTLNGINTSVTLYSIFTKAGNHTLVITATDKYGNTSSKTINFNVVPNNNLSNSTILLGALTGNGSAFANNSDIYSYTLNLKDEFNNPIYNKKIISINQNCNGITGCNTIKLDNINKSGGDSLIEKWKISTNINGVTNATGSIPFELSSYTPGSFTEKFDIKLKKWNNKFIDLTTTQNINIGNNNVNTFKKPVKGNLKVSSDSGATWNSIPKLGTTQKYKIILNNIGSLPNINGYIDINNSNIIDTVIGHKLQNLPNLRKNFSSFSADTFFNARINATSNVLKAPIISTNNLDISYTLGGKTVKYYLDNFSISGSGQTNLGVKVIGILQGGGKASLTGQKANFSNISKSTTRLGLKRKIYTMIKGMKSNTMVNGIRYIKGQDVTVNGNTFTVNGGTNTRDFETLVVEDGNLIISGNITTTMGIFVLNNNLGNKSKGNVYVNQDVTKIDAIIYTDGGFISADTSGSPYTVDNSARTSALQKQLILTGSLFTRNTIGGAVLGTSGKYLLPGGNTTTNFDSAMIYDLNYIRRGNVGCLDITGGNPSGADGICDNYNDYFIIIYNPIIQTNPPKGF